MRKIVIAAVKKKSQAVDTTKINFFFSACGYGDTGFYVRGPKAGTWHRLGLSSSKQKVKTDKEVQKLADYCADAQFWRFLVLPDPTKEEVKCLHAAILWSDFGKNDNPELVDLIMNINPPAIFRSAPPKTCYRGIVLKDEVLKSLLEKGSLSLRDCKLASWSPEQYIARKFAGWQPRNRNESAIILKEKLKGPDVLLNIEDLFRHYLDEKDFDSFMANGMRWGNEHEILIKNKPQVVTPKNIVDYSISEDGKVFKDPNKALTHLLKYTK
jgi:hypothetical protein